MKTSSKTKVCPKCNKQQPLTSYGCNNATLDGLQYKCKSCIADYRKDHAEARRVSNRAYRLRNLEKIGEARKQAYRKNPEREYELSKIWKKAHPEKVKEYRRRHYWKNPERERAAVLAWAKKNPEKTVIIVQRRRARMRNAEGSYTLEEWKNKCLEYRNRCAYCLKVVKLTVQHVQPLSKGGSNYISNIVPACRSCNARAGSKTIKPGEQTW